MRRFEPLEVDLCRRTLVEASAGTGKTHAITTLVLRLVLEAGLGIERILVVTFTEAATAELRDRVRKRLAEALAAFERGAAPEKDGVLGALLARSPDRARDRARLDLALRNVDLAAISTIHGFCHRVLHDSAFDSGVAFEQDLVADPRALRDQVLADYFVARMHDAPRGYAQALHESGVSQKELQSLVARVDEDPDVKLQPDPPGAGVAAPADDAVAAALERARAAWDPATVAALLRGPAVNHVKYGLKKIDGWCQRMTRYLAQPPEPPHLDDKLIKFCAARLRQAINKGFTAPEHPFFDACDALRAACDEHAEHRRGEAVAFLHGLAAYARRQLPRQKDELGVLSFDDLLVFLRDALRGASGDALARQVRSRLPVALVDEFQDTDPVQYEIFARIYDHADARLFLVGDPKQAIYSFRGADVFAYMRAVAATEAERRFTMPHNWRSGPSLVAAVNQVFLGHERPFLFDEIGYPEVTAQPDARDQLESDDPARRTPLEVLFVPRIESDGKGTRQHAPNVHKAWQRRALPQLVAVEITALLDGRCEIAGERIRPQQIAVLTRTNDQAFEVQDALRTARVPSVVLGDRSVFEQPEAGELSRLLQAVADPTRGTALRAALTTELLGVSANELAAMEDGSGAFEEYVQAFRDLHAVWTGKGFVQMFRALLQRFAVQQRLLALTDGERRMTNVLHLMELLHTAAVTQHLGPTGLLHWLRQQRDVQGYPADSAQIRLESDAGAVRITTVHRAKGLEYDVVLCPYLWNGWLLHPESRRMLRFHDDQHAAVVDVDPKRPKDGAATEAAERESLAESLRLLYVALTRARHKAIVVWGAFRDWHTSALAYLLHTRGENLPPAASALKSMLERRKDDQIREDLAALAQRAGGGVLVREVSREVAPAVYRGGGEDSAGALAARTFGNAWDRGFAIASFTRLADRGQVAVDDEGRERDAQPLELLPQLPPEAPRPAAVPVTLAAFPRGARPGNFFHDLLERLDFQADAAARRALVEQRLRAHGFGSGHAAVVDQAMAEVLATPLPVGATLADVPRARRLDELEFHLPLAARRDAERLTPERLAAAFAEHPSAALPGGYAERLLQQRFTPLFGFLKGFIDLLFEHDGRYYVVDYKSTHLGDDRADYGPDAVREAMVHGDYVLQYHLYLVAAHRYLRQRLRGYDPDRHLGGAVFLFLRGMHPDAPPGLGMFFEQPPRARIEALDAVLAGGAR